MVVGGEVTPHSRANSEVCEDEDGWRTHVGTGWLEEVGILRFINKIT